LGERTGLGLGRIEVLARQTKLGPQCTETLRLDRAGGPGAEAGDRQPVLSPCVAQGQAEVTGAGTHQRTALPLLERASDECLCASTLETADRIGGLDLDRQPAPQRARERLALDLRGTAEDRVDPAGGLDDTVDRQTVHGGTLATGTCRRAAFMGLAARPRRRSD